MPVSTKLEKLIFDPLAARLTTVENKVTTIEGSNFIANGANITLLNNNANYQTLAQVDSKINALINGAPGTLDTLGEIAAALATEDSAIAALTTVNNTQNTAIAANTASNTAQDNLIATLQTQIASLLLRNQIRRLSLTGNITLSSADASTQHLIVPTAVTRTVTLPSTPATSQLFYVINSTTSTGSISINGETITASQRYAVQWDGTQWVEL